MTEAITVHINYRTRSKGRELYNDTLLLALGLDYEASKYGVHMACNSLLSEQRLDLILFGEPSKLEIFLDKLRSKEIEYKTVEDYSISEPKPYDGQTPDWFYHDLVATTRAAYLRAEYMKDVRVLLEELIELQNKK